VRQRGVGSQSQQAILLARAFLVNLLAGVEMTLWCEPFEFKTERRSCTPFSDRKNDRQLPRQARDKQNYM
jgi:endonuclease YncB( thermonuclease family)